MAHTRSDLNLRTTALFCLLGCVVTLAACGSDRHLVGQGGALEPAPRALTISAREAVRRLIVVLWNQPTDAALIAEADSGVFQTSEDIRRLALRMLADPRARVGVGAFYRSWLMLNKVADVTKDTTLFPDFTAELRTDMATETELLGVHVTLDIDGVLETLFTTPFSFLTERLAGIYGVAGVTGADHRKVALDPAQRAGIVTQPSFLAQTAMPTRTAPTLRGKFIAEQMTCKQIPAPPPGISPLSSAQPPTGTTRQRVAAHMENPACAGCHRLMDPIGFTLEGFDAIGRARTTDNGAPIDVSAQVQVGDVSGAINGARELAQRLAASADVAQCFSDQWLSFALGRPLTNTDQADAMAVASRFASSGLSLREVIAAALQTDVFLASATLR